MDASLIGADALATALGHEIVVGWATLTEVPDDEALRELGPAELADTLPGVAA
jgi:hypothetical protein